MQNRRARRAARRRRLRGWCSVGPLAWFGNAGLADVSTY